MKNLLRLALVFAVFGCLKPEPVGAALAFPNGSSWRYLIGTAEASTPNTLWRGLGFSDVLWSTGTAPVGYGETDIVTAVPTSAVTDGNYLSIFFRKTFNVANPNNVSQINLTLRVDDGVVVWINGTEVGRDTVPAGDLAFNAMATAGVEPHDVLITINNPASVLVAGDNVLAVHLFNALNTSSDIYLDGSMTLVEPDPIPPTLVSVDPVGGTLNQLTQVAVTFSEAVAGVDAGDLLVSDVPATSVLGAGSSYTFLFPQPAYGTVNVRFSPTHGIVDTALPIPNNFDHSAPNATWEYTLVDVIAPTVASIQPTPGGTVTSLSEIRVQFSEPVAGVDVADLRINGSPASTLDVVSASAYTFQFTQPTNGLVSVEWATPSGITDLATVPNAFDDSGTWAYNLDTNAVAGALFITEFMADNGGALRDEDGQSSDWIEIYNSGDIVADLDGWHLTDDPNNLAKWEFPKTNLAAKAYMIIFASEKNRRTPGAPLHTNFRLDNNGEFLALVKPDGQTIVSAFSPVFPPQVEDVSYGVPTASTAVTLLASNGQARVLVPGNGTLGLDWTTSGFSDASWTAATNGIGFEGSPGTSPNLSGSIATDVQGQMRNINSSVYVRLPFVVEDAAAIDLLTLRMKYDDGYIAWINGTEVARRNAYTVVARSTNDFSSVQGSNNWYYGYYNKTADLDHTYQSSDFTPFPAAGGAWGANNYWTGSRWDWFNGNPPWTEISIDGAHPNGSNNTTEHWAMRRWVSEVTGTITVLYRLSKSNTGGGNGVTGRILHNGVEVFTKTIAFNDGSNVTNTVRIVGVAAGDFIDFAVDATGTDEQPTDSSDGSINTMQILHDEGVFPDWNVAAVAAHADGDAIQYEDQDISGAIQGLTAGVNILAIQGLNVGVSDDDFLIGAVVESRMATVQPDQPRYFTQPTPGRANGLGVDALGPVVSDFDHEPDVPLDNQDLLVTVKVTPTFEPINSVTLFYRVMYGTESSVAMTDNGLGADPVAGDGYYSALIPASLSTPGQMIRWYARATDVLGRVTRLPAFEDALNSAQYDGTIVFAPQTNNLPVLHLFLQNLTAANNAAGTRGSIFYLGRFYDNIWMNNHGQSSSGFPKHSYDIDFNPGDNFTWKDGEDLVDDINLLTPYPDKAYMRNFLAYEDVYKPGGGPYHFVELVRVHNNAGFLGVWHMVENGDDNFLDRVGYDSNGALYKMYNTFMDASDFNISPNAEAEKKTRKQEGNADLRNFFYGITTNNTAAQTNYMYDNVNLPATVNFLAARIVTGDVDCCHKNYYFYRDTEGTGEWEGMPWDLDLSFGRNWNGSGKSYWDNAMYPMNGLDIGSNNGFFSKVLNHPNSRQMYLRRLRTLMDEVLQPTNTPPERLFFEKEADRLGDLLRPDAALDIALNGTWPDGSAGPIFNTADAAYETLDEAITRLKAYLPDRRRYLYGLGTIPASQPTNAVITFGAIEYNPSSGDQTQEYIELRNTNAYAVDISGWKLSGAVEHTFKPGTVIPSNNVSLFLSPDVRAFRARGTSPRGRENRFVQGNYNGQLSARGESLVLHNKAGWLVISNTYPGNPSLPQQYLRITEIMYHPAAAPAGGPFLTEDYEYMELRNIGDQTISLAGVRFTNGVDFKFTGSAVTSLAPGERVLVVKNQAAFTSRHGSGWSIAGEYVGQLDNGGENIRLDDSVGEKILDFRYNNSWYPTTDGVGFSLVIVDETAPHNTWDRKESWRPSGEANGSPGEIDPPQATVAPILVNEVLTHTDLPSVDAVEFYNTNSVDVNIGGWFLTDDFLAPRKYRIPDNFIVPAGGYGQLTEADFNSAPGVPPSFSFSSKGDEVYLFSGDGTDLTGYFHGHEFGAAANGVAFGRHITSEGKVHFVAQSANTPLAANALPRVGPVVISEIMYHPPDLPGGDDNSNDEYIELRNISASTVFLRDLARPTNTWILRKAVNFNFPTNSAPISAGNYVLVVNFEPARSPAKAAAFRAKYQVPANVPLYGPYEGQLANDEEDIELYRPDTPELSEVPYILVDRVDYKDGQPSEDGTPSAWPSLSDGFGPALVRQNDSAYGNDPINWRAAAPSPGQGSIAGTPPTITTHPTNKLGVLGQDVTLSVRADGAAPLRYQWLYNGAGAEDGTTADLLLSNLKLADSGGYQVAVFNGGGAVLSSNAQLTVLIPAFITAQPISQNARQGSNVTFSVAVSSSTPVTYQWRKDGQDLLGKTGPSLMILNVQETDGGDYTVLITDAVATQESAPATLTVLINPSIVNLATQYTVVQGGSVTLSVEARGSLPMGYRWRRRTTTLTNQTAVFSYQSFHTVSNVQPAIANSSNNYTVIITNAANFTPGLPSVNIFITVLTDTDGDGLPDAWEDENGLDKNSSSDGTADKDGDGVSNRDEYTAGTDPSDPESYLKVQGISAQGPVQIEFLAASNRTYSILYKNSLDLLDWTKFTDVVSSPSNRVVTVQDPTSDARRFYRLVTPRQN